ncbi:unnamed protein product [Phytophthora fragariaefolia]|uniref:Unnamed protein product n=1 Tax=Phytophthora fragariaefolia TaxID=1490495 RepID=A0A9W6TQF8_9STRA|nr:unnamed protein product [Phytophthora fragariaefolia]
MAPTSSDYNDITPAERDVFAKYRQVGTRRAAFGGLLGATAMAGLWNAAALGTTMGVVGVLGSCTIIADVLPLWKVNANKDLCLHYPVGGAIGARTSLRTSNTRHELFTELLRLPGDQAPHAAQAREMYVLEWTVLPSSTRTASDDDILVCGVQSSDQVGAQCLRVGTAQGCGTPRCFGQDRGRSFQAPVKEGMRRRLAPRERSPPSPPASPSHLTAPEHRSKT